MTPDPNVWTRRAFGETSDPAAYVPRPATEACLDQIGAWVDACPSGATVATLIAPPGFGKTFLLRCCEARLHSTSREPRALYLPYAGIEIQDLAVWVHGLLGRRSTIPGSGSDVLSGLASLVVLGRGATDPFYLVIDDADSMPMETVQVLVQGLPRTGSPLRLLLAMNDDARASRLLAALDPIAPVETALRERMTEAETKHYLEARLRHAGVLDPDALGLDEESIARIHALSGGVPSEVHRLATAQLENSQNPLPEELDAKNRREDWLGSPIDEGV